ncbi:ABC transporter substrate-binding protein [Arthrobacter sp. zg-ZUI100]|uniref:ABC transporter substrate-binding protein n=1 Tax=Arthrobacter jiangjiafuii TaxID=2817475 RepID=UPI001AEEF1E1|nr:ABC transporter substrate-binding protein [Arthrobacter jiangjiafuii]MBP3035457.1 ABC transporter substrate-binding protein [Arthrobacter jiangjiafuii]
MAQGPQAAQEHRNEQPGSGSNPLRMGVFSISPVLAAAWKKGFFADNDVHVVYEQVQSSDQQFQDFAAGNYDVLQTAWDNVVNYRTNASNNLGRPLYAMADFALDLGMGLTVTSPPEITSMEAIRGGEVAVDARNSGYAYVIYYLLEQAGLARDEDYTVVRHGGLAERYLRLSDGFTAATLLSDGLEALAQQQGMNQLADESALGMPYVGSVAAWNGDWYAEHRDVGERFRESYEAALAWVLDPGHRDEVVDLVANVRGLPKPDARLVVDAELGPWGIARDTNIADDAARSVIGLRQQYNGFDDDPVVDPYGKLKPFFVNNGPDAS